MGKYCFRPLRPPWKRGRENGKDKNRNRDGQRATTSAYGRSGTSLSVTIADDGASPSKHALSSTITAFIAKETHMNGNGIMVKWCWKSVFVLYLSTLAAALPRTGKRR